MTHTVTLIPGDGIGPEIADAVQKVLAAAGAPVQWDLQPLDETILKGTKGVPPAAVLDSIHHNRVALKGPLMTPVGTGYTSLNLVLRKTFDLYANVRPAKTRPGVRSRYDNVDIIVVRENTEGEYSSVGGRMFEGTEREFVTQQSCFTRKGVDRIMKFAFDLALTRPRKHVTSATKSNGISITMPYWDERFAAMGARYPQVKTSQYHIDGLTIQMVLNPQRFDVIVGSNLFGDILSDLGPATAGTIGIAPSANLNPERAFPSLFEPVHGSAPDIYGRAIANPIGQIWSGAMMLDHLGEPAAGAAIVAAIEKAMAPGSGAPRTPDIGGRAKTEDLGKAIAEAV